MVENTGDSTNDYLKGEKMNEPRHPAELTITLSEQQSNSVRYWAKEAKLSPVSLVEKAIDLWINSFAKKPKKSGSSAPNG